MRTFAESAQASLFVEHGRRWYPRFFHSRDVPNHFAFCRLSDGIVRSLKSGRHEIGTMISHDSTIPLRDML